MTAATNELATSQFWDLKLGLINQSARPNWLRALVRRKWDRLLMEFLRLPGSSPADVLELSRVAG